MEKLEVKVTSARLRSKQINKMVKSKWAQDAENKGYYYAMGRLKIVRCTALHPQRDK